jgi:ketosteroid isomerase-like protein
MEVVREAGARLSRGDFDGLMELYLPDSEWVMPPEWPEHHVYRGVDAIRDLARIGIEGFDNYRFEETRLAELDDGRVLGLFTIRGNIKGSLVPVETEFGGIYTLRGDRLLRVEAFFAWADALRAAGLGDPRRGRSKPAEDAPPQSRSVSSILGQPPADRRNRDV